MPVLGAAPEVGDTRADGGVYGGQHLDSSVMRCLHSRSIGPGNVTSQALHLHTQAASLSSFNAMDLGSRSLQHSWTWL